MTTSTTDNLPDWPFFDPGRVMITPAVQALDESVWLPWLQQHLVGDWGEVSEYPEDVAENDKVFHRVLAIRATRNGEVPGRLPSRYTDRGTGESYYIITEWYNPAKLESAVTTILSVWEY